MVEADSKPDPPSAPLTSTAEVLPVATAVAEQGGTQNPHSAPSYGRHPSWLQDPDMQYIKGAAVGPTDSMLDAPAADHAENSPIDDQQPGTEPTMLNTNTVDYNTIMIGTSTPSPHIHNSNDETVQIMVAHLVEEDQPNASHNCLPDTSTPGGRRLCFGIVVVLVLGAVGVATVGFVCGGGSCSPTSDTMPNSVPLEASTPIPTTLRPTTSIPTPIQTSAEVSTGSINILGESYDIASTTEISSPSRDATGTLPTELGLLTALTFLNLSHTQVTGTLPTELGLLTALTFFLLDFDGLTGTLPTELGLLTALTFFQLDFDGLTGTLPTELGLLTLLEALSLWKHELNETLPTELGSLTELTFLDLPQNEFTGTLPTELGLLTALAELWLFDNQLIGTLPTELGLMSALGELWLYGNKLTGTLPTELGLLTSLTSLSLALSENHELTGSVPASYCYIGDLNVCGLSCPCVSCCNSNP